MSLFGLSCIPVSREQCNIVRCTYLGRHNVCDVTGRRSNADRSCCSVRAVASRRRYSHEWRVCYTGVYRVCVLLVCIVGVYCWCVLRSCSVYVLLIVKSDYLKRCTMVLLSRITNTKSHNSIV